MNEVQGKVYIVGTPIGNLKDITLRALETLKNVDFILAEDTRRTIKLLNFYNVSGRELISFNSHNALKKIPMVINRVQTGQCCAVVTDSGMPVISDPGYKLVRECWAKKIEIDVIPGPSALTAAVALSGLVSSEFTFLGFIPRGKNRRRLFRKLVNHEYPIVFFESPYRITETLEDILDILGNKEIFIGRELTKIHQELIRSSVKDLIEEFKKRGKILGEITVVLK